MPWDEIKSSTYTKYSDFSATIALLNAAHDVRMKSSKEFNYLLQDITEFKKRDTEVSLPLNEQALRKQRDELEAKSFERENQRRVSRGLAALKKGESKPAKEENYDFVRDETLQIVTDFISDPKVAKNIKL